MLHCAANQFLNSNSILMWVHAIRSGGIPVFHNQETIAFNNQIKSINTVTCFYRAKMQFED